MKYAFVTVLSTNNYYKGVVALFESIKRTNTKYNNFVVVVNEDIFEYIIDDLKRRGYYVIRRNKIVFNSINYNNYKYWQNTFDKFHVFDLIEFDKIVYLDSDMIVVKNIDELFDFPHMSAVVAGRDRVNEWKEICSGLMVIEPKLGTADGLINTLKNTNFNKEIGDQDVIEKYFDWKNKNLAISENYNLFADYLDYYINDLGYSNDKIAVVHFIGSKKPWMLNKKEREVLLKNNFENKKTFYNSYLIKYLNILDKVGKKLSIITPFYKTLSYTKKLASVLEPQLNDDVEWIIIDDGTNEIELDKLDAKVVHLKENSGNASKPRNVGLDIASGEFITFIDSDDMISNDYIKVIIDKIDKEHFDYCYFGWQTKNNKYIIEEEPPKWNHCIWNCIYKRDIIGDNKFNEDYNLDEDGDFNNRVRKGKRSNILDILYTYSFLEREDSISSLYKNGIIDFHKD